jgi:hypothetical protein
MTGNMGAVDRVGRFVIGALLIAYAVPIGFAPGGWNWLGWIGIVPLATALLGICPLYTLVGVSTCPVKQPG